MHGSEELMLKESYTTAGIMMKEAYSEMYPLGRSWMGEKSGKFYEELDEELFRKVFVGEADEVERANYSKKKP